MSAASYVPFAKGLVAWLVTAMASGLIGLVVGGLLIPLTSVVLAPAWRSLSGLWRRA